MVKLGRLSPLTEQLRNSSRVEDHLWSQKMEQAGARKIEVEIRKKVLVASMSANDASVELLKEQLNKSEAKKAKLQGFLVRRYCHALFLPLLKLCTSKGVVARRNTLP
jgi:chromosome segregation ATPase